MSQIVQERRPDTLMLKEAGDAAASVAQMLAANCPAIATLASRLRSEPPAAIVTCARGSSDHAATYGKYLFETLLGIPVSSAAPSVASVYGRDPHARGTLCIAISQSGRSPDLLATMEAYRRGGAMTLALVNDETSPLAAMADHCICLEAGPEHSVAATKSYIASLAALAAIAAAWAVDPALREAVATLPDDLARAFALDWSAVEEDLADARNLFVIGRGYGFAIAQEAALKFKETCGLHAEAFSAAEVRHGPMALLVPGFPVLAFATSDTAGDSVRDIAAEFAARDASVRMGDAAAPESGGLPTIASHPAIEPILMIQSFYRMVNALAVRRGLNPDAPAHLSKVTRTV